MFSGRQLADGNVKIFTAWAASKTDDDFRCLAHRGVLSRTDIAAECGFAKSVLNQNPRVRDELKNLEDQLRDRGVLPKPAVEGPEDVTAAVFMSIERGSSARDAERLKRLEQENASLRAELCEVKRALSRYVLLQEALAETGRLPR